jgi:hypothetical protein
LADQDTKRPALVALAAELADIGVFGRRTIIGRGRPAALLDHKCAVAFLLGSILIGRIYILNPGSDGIRFSAGRPILKLTIADQLPARRQRCAGGSSCIDLNFLARVRRHNSIASPHVDPAATHGHLGQQRLARISACHAAAILGVWHIDAIAAAGGQAQAEQVCFGDDHAVAHIGILAAILRRNIVARIAGALPELDHLALLGPA